MLPPKRALRAARFSLPGAACRGLRDLVETESRGVIRTGKQLDLRGRLDTRLVRGDRPTHTRSGLTVTVPIRVKLRDSRPQRAGVFRLAA